jgi:putative SOS response-associated peptidase YedK
MIKARAETLLKKPSFRNLVSQRRCLIPADGFYEWRREGNRKVPVIYDREMGRQWLEHSYGSFQNSLDAVLRPGPSEHMEAWDVSPNVNAPANDTPECIQPLPAGRARTGQLPLL